MVVPAIISPAIPGDPDDDSLREYHNAVLRAGSVPAGVLEKLIDAYIARTTASA